MDKKSSHKNADMGNKGFHRMILGQIVGDIGFEEENVPCNTPRSSSTHARFGGSAGKTVASTSGSTGTASVSPCEYLRDPGSILSLQPWIFKRSGSQNNDDRMLASGSSAVGKGKNTVDGFQDGSAVEVSPRSPVLGSGPGRGRGSLRSSRPRRHLIKPFVTMENSYIPQLYSEDFEIEECTFAPVPSPASSRPFIVTDGRRIISKSRYEPVHIPFNIGSEEECRNSSRILENIVGISPLPELKKAKSDRRESHNARLDLCGSQSSKPSKPTGLLDRLLVFSTGVSIGIISSSLTNKNECDTLKGTLARMENLVQDLHDELEMKEALTVKELPNETSAEHQDDNSKVHVVDSEPMSKIEEELEAELARLELNMASNHLEEQTFDFSEVDQEFIGDIVLGELKIDMVRRDLTDYSSESDHGRDSRESSPNCNANYPVSPRDLSLRLHKVIQHRLEERIKELETTLAQRQKQEQVQLVATERVFSERTCSNSDSGSSDQESPLFLQETSPLAEPFCLNLAGDALDAYDEAYEEFMRIADSPCTTSTNGKPQVNEDYSVDRSLIWGLEDGSARNLTKVPSWEQILKSGEPNRTQESDRDDDDESDDNDDQDSKMLIQQIVQRTKQGSPVLIHAQRMLFSVDE